MENKMVPIGKLGTAPWVSGRARSEPTAPGPQLRRVPWGRRALVPERRAPWRSGDPDFARGWKGLAPRRSGARRGRTGPAGRSRPRLASKSRGWLVPPVAALLLSGCASGATGSRGALAGTAGSATGSQGALTGTAADAEFYLEGGWVTVSVINGFTGQKVATIPAPRWAGSFPWVGHTTWYPCGASADDRTFLLCGKSKYVELRLGGDGKPVWTSTPAVIPAPARNTGSNGDPQFAVSADGRVAAVTTSDGILALSLLRGATRSWTLPASEGYATSLSWAGDRYLAFQLVPQARDHKAGGVRLLDIQSGAPTVLSASRLIVGTERSPGDGITGVFNPVITPDGSKVLSAAWTGFLVAELVEFSSATGQLVAVLIPPAHMPGHGMPCQVLWTNLSGNHLIADCGVAGVANGGRLMTVRLFIPNTSGTAVGIVW